METCLLFFMYKTVEMIKVIRLSERKFNVFTLFCRRGELKFIFSI